MTSSSQDQLALFGGPPVAPRPFRRYNSIGREEAAAATAVIESGVLSQYIGAWHADFYGGPKVLEFEAACRAYFGVKHAVSVNSATSGLIAALGALDLAPGDEVIVSPWTMCASATAILHWNAIPVFADIESTTFCLDPDSVEAAVTPHTRAIMSPDIFGHPANLAALQAIAHKHNLKLISDAAQAPGARDQGRHAGTLADAGVFSLNYHKHIHTGEGGIVVTNDDRLAERMQLIRNHAEAVVGAKGVTDLGNMIGHNFRLGEIECAIGIEQLKKLDRFVAGRQQVAGRFTAGLAGLRGLRPPQVRSGCSHAYYVYPLVLDPAALGVNRARLKEALNAEGLTCIMGGYQNVHLLPVYQRKIAYGSGGFPWVPGIARREIDYRKGICPVAEQLHDATFLGIAICVHEFDNEETDLAIAAFQKVWRHLDQLR